MTAATDDHEPTVRHHVQKIPSKMADQLAHVYDQESEREYVAAHLAELFAGKGRLIVDAARATDFDEEHGSEYAARATLTTARQAEHYVARLRWVSTVPGDPKPDSGNDYEMILETRHERSAPLPLSAPPPPRPSP